MAAELFGSVLTLLICFCFGYALLRYLRLPLLTGEIVPFSMLCGGAVTSAVNFWICVCHASYPAVYLLLGVISLVLAGTASKLPTLPCDISVSRFDGWQRVAFILVFLLFAVTYSFVALAPEVSFDGSTYHLGFVHRYAREHGFVPVYTNYLAGLPEGLEMLYLIAFTFGRNSAAALVHLAYWMVLPWLILSYFRRIRRTNAGVLAGLLMFTSPIVAMNGSCAYVDTCLIAVCFAVFALLQIWKDSPDWGTLFTAALLAGFAVSIKYTGYPAALYLVFSVAFHLRRNRALLLRQLPAAALIVGVLILPWIGRNWTYYRNPLIPFANRVFPNPYVSLSLEENLRRGMAAYNGVHWSLQLPLELTVRGTKLQGIFGPVFLFLPFALLSAYWPPGRQLLLAGLVFAIPYPSNIGSRFIMPAMVFWGPAMAMCLAEFGFAAVLFGVLMVLTAWPKNIHRYATWPAFYVSNIPAAVVFHPSRREWFLETHEGGYRAARLLDLHTPNNARVLTLQNVPDAYTHAEVIVSYQGALNLRLLRELYAPSDMTSQTLHRITFPVAPGSWREFRIRATAPGPVEIYSIRAVASRRTIGLQHLTAASNPWDAPLVADNNPVTCWRSDDPGSADTYIQFTTSVTPDAITADLGSNHSLDLQARATENNSWQTIASTNNIANTVLPPVSTLDIPAGMVNDRPATCESDPHTVQGPCTLEHAAAADLLANNVHFILVKPGEPPFQSLSTHPERWPAVLVGQTPGYSLFKLLP